MASDEDYASFLEKANADPNEGRVKTQDKSKGGAGAQLKAVDDGASVPKELRDAVKGQVFVSDADEPFEVVSLSLKGAGAASAKGAAAKKGEELPDEGEFFYYGRLLLPLYSFPLSLSPSLPLPSSLPLSPSLPLPLPPSLPLDRKSVV